MITLSQKAFHTIQRLKAENHRPYAALRIAVLGGDCAGLKYFIGLDEFRAADDIAVDYDGQLVYVDITSMQYVAGAVIDWAEVEDDAGFILFNPNKGRGKSGCGSDGNGGGCMTKGDGNTCEKTNGACACVSAKKKVCDTKPNIEPQVVSIGSL